jgi:hypothetical protein
MFEILRCQCFINLLFVSPLSALSTPFPPHPLFPLPPHPPPPQCAVANLVGCVADIEFFADTNKYYPVVYINDYWNLHSDYMPINSTTK